MKIEQELHYLINKVMANYNTVVLISIFEIEAREICERVQGEFIDDFDKHHEFRRLRPDRYKVYPISDFMNLVNDSVELDNLLREYFITFVVTEKDK